MSRWFYEETEDLLGARMVVEREPAQLAARIIDDLQRRRQLLLHDAAGIATG